MTGLAGCGGGLPPGAAGLTVTPLAEPKAGYTQPADTGGGYGAGAGGPETAVTAAADPFRLVDYRNLEGVVVYIVPTGGTAVGPPAAAPQPPVVTIDAGDPDGPGRRGVNLTRVEGLLVVRNTTPRPATFYLRSETGALTDLGTVPPGGSVRHVLSAAGPLSVFREADGPDDERLAGVFLAPAGWAQKAVGGGAVTFAQLPPGRYTLMAWHPRLANRRRSVARPDHRRHGHRRGQRPAEGAVDGKDEGGGMKDERASRCRSQPARSFILHPSAFILTPLTLPSTPSSRPGRRAGRGRCPS
jgi:hypothetical protein